MFSVVFFEWNFRVFVYGFLPILPAAKLGLAGNPRKRRKDSKRRRRDTA